MKSSCLAILFVIFLLHTSACRHEVQQLENPCSYSRHIQPIIATKCAINSYCHGDGSVVADFTDFSVLKQRADSGKIHLRVFELQIMPPGNFEQLTEDERNKLKCWLDNGAKQD